MVNVHRAPFGRGDSSSTTSSVVTWQPGRCSSTRRSRLEPPCSFGCVTPARPTRTYAHLSEGGAADTALLFTCNGRGRRLFRQAHHDATVVPRQPARPAGGGHVLRRRDRPVRRPQLPPRVHRLRGAADRYPAPRVRAAAEPRLPTLAPLGSRRGQTWAQQWWLTQKPLTFRRSPVTVFPLMEGVATVLFKMADLMVAARFCNPARPEPLRNGGQG